MAAELAEGSRESANQSPSVNQLRSEKGLELKSSPQREMRLEEELRLLREFASKCTGSI